MKTTLVKTRSTRHTPRVRRIRRGAAAMLAMLFLVLFTTLSVAMLGLSTSNTQSASNLAEVARAQDSAESGLRWMQYRFLKMQRPKTTVGNITASVASTLWPTLQTAIVNDFGASTVNGSTNWNQLQNAAERPWTVTANEMTSAMINLDNGGGTFKLKITKHPIGAGDPLDARYIRVSCTGTYKLAKRSVAMDFKLDKKIKFAVVGKVPIQVGRDTIIEGNVAMATANKYPAIQMLSDFQHFDNALKTKVLNFETFLKNNHAGYDGRVAMSNTAEATAAANAGYTDYTQDGFIDEFDLLVKQYDSNNDRKLSSAEFTNSSTGQSRESNLFQLIDGLGAPLFSGDVIRAGYQDSVLDTKDGYAKIKGTLTMTTTAEAWNSAIAGAGETISSWIQGPITPTDIGAPPIKFGAAQTDLLDLSPANFDACAEGFHTQIKVGGVDPPAMTSTPAQGATVIGKKITAARANNGTVTEKTPFGSTTYQATYKRPVYKNVTFRNCIIEKGTNALFDGCTFEGVTFVDMTKTITNSSGSTTTNKDDGMTWSKTKVTGTGSFTTTAVLVATGTPAAGELITKGSQLGNNVRFNNCNFKGPVAGTAATAYTHFSNSWEFTGATLFNNQVDQTATIVAPNTNIEMGSFTNPTAAPSLMIGVVVAGNIDIRGTSNVDGAIIVTGDGAGNTTLGYFGPSDGDTNPSAMPEGGYGRLDIRYNPNRALPDGINIAIDVLPDTDSYKEGYSVQ
ncbi:MAG: hypothetical protein H7Z14_17160 [Anaerolineae bacterium]|nr:hypothetical protein [Phycisphaerae bacterium]